MVKCVWSWYPSKTVRFAIWATGRALANRLGVSMDLLCFYPSQNLLQVQPGRYGPSTQTPVPAIRSHPARSIIINGAFPLPARMTWLPLFSRGEHRFGLSIRPLPPRGEFLPLKVKVLTGSRGSGRG